MQAKLPALATAAHGGGQRNGREQQAEADALSGIRVQDESRHDQDDSSESARFRNMESAGHTPVRQLTLALTGARPMTFDMQTERRPGVQCRARVRCPVPHDGRHGCLYSKTMTSSGVN